MQSGIAGKNNKGVVELSAKGRILALKLLEKQKRFPEHANQIGIEVKMKEKKQKESSKHLSWKEQIK